MSEYAFDRQLREFYPPPPSGEPLPSYPEQVEYQPDKEVRSSDIRACQSMIRKIYSLRVDAFNARDVRRGNQEIVTGWKNQASAGLKDLKSIVHHWSQRQDWSPDEKIKVDQIRQRILAIQPDG